MNRLVIFFLLIFFLSHCSSNSQEKEYHLGAILAVTGSGSWLGEPEKKTLELYVNKLNAKGGLKGKKIKLHIEDSEGRPEKAVQAFQKLVLKNKVKAIIGPTRSGSSVAVAPLADRYQIPLIALAASDAITKDKQGNIRPFVFSLAQKTDDAVAKIYDELSKKKIRKIAIFTGATGFGSDGRLKLKQLAVDYDFDLVADEVYQAGDTDMISLLLKAKNNGAEGIVNWSILPTQSIVLKNAQQLKINIPIYQSHGFGNIKYVIAAGDASEGVIFPGGRLLIARFLEAAHDQKKILLDYQTNYESHYREPVSTFGGHAFDAFNLWLAAIKSGNESSMEIKNYIENKKSFVGTSGIYHFSAKDHNGLDKTAFSLIKVKQGEFTLYSH